MMNCEVLRRKWWWPKGDNIQAFLERLKETMKLSVRLVGGPFEIRREHPQNISLERSRETNLLAYGDFSLILWSEGIHAEGRT